MLSAVEFDHEPRARACEVGDKVPDRKLPAEAELAESSSSKVGPQLLFCVGLIAAQPAGAMVWEKDGLHILFDFNDSEIIRTAARVL